MSIKSATVTLSAVLSLTLVGTAFAATPASVTVGGKTYYKVSAGTTQNTGTKVCTAVGKACIGYTNLASNNVCKAFHPTAKSLGSVNGSKAGFYCDGAPQTGLACAKYKNTCEVCPTCNVNADCTFDVSGLFREMYVECGTAAKSSSSSARSVIPAPKPVVLPPPTSPIGSYPGSIACDYYQAKKKVVSCKVYKAADTFCTIAMQSRFAKAAECTDGGRIICTKPCVTNPKEVMISQCAYDPERRRGYQAAPYNFCTTTTTITVPKPPASSTAAKKHSGETCNNGGDCLTGICLGTGRPYGSNLQQCSCSQFGLDVSCGR